MKAQKDPQNCVAKPWLPLAAAAQRMLKNIKQTQNLENPRVHFHIAPIIIFYELVCDTQVIIKHFINASFSCNHYNHTMSI